MPPEPVPPEPVPPEPVPPEPVPPEPVPPEQSDLPEHSDLPEAELVALAERVRRARPRCGEVVVVAVDGPSGAGKTRLAARLASLLADVPGGVGVVHVDDLCPGWDGLDAAVPRLVDGVLHPLAQGRPGRLRRWDWLRDAEGPDEPVPDARVLVVEGVASGARECAPFLSLLVWLDGPESGRRVRALRRDGATYAPNWERWAAQERAHYAREGTADRADAAYSMGGATGRG